MNASIRQYLSSDEADYFRIFIRSAVLHLRNAGPSHVPYFRKHKHHPLSSRPAAPDPTPPTPRQQCTSPQRSSLTTGADQSSFRRVFTLRNRIHVCGGHLFRADTLDSDPV